MLNRLVCRRVAQWSVTFALVVGMWGCQQAQGAPSQRGSKPGTEASMVFNHQIHAGKFEIPCQYCHAYADQARVAGIPSLRKCMGCHKFGPKDNPAVQRLALLFEAGKSPSFARVNDLPDYVYFSHRVHVQKSIQCDACHGAVATMRTVVPAHKFTMGFCLDCHRQRGASVDCVACHQ